MDSEREIELRLQAATRRRQRGDDGGAIETAAATSPGAGGGQEESADPGAADPLPLPAPEGDLAAPGLAAEELGHLPPAEPPPVPEPSPDGTGEAPNAVADAGPSAPLEETPVVEPPLVEPPPPPPPVVDVADLDWDAVLAAADPGAVRSRLRHAVERLEDLLDQDGGPGMLFDEHRQGRDDRAIQVGELAAATPLWFVGDLHGDLLALEAALALVRRADGDGARLVLLGDLFDDGGHGAEVLARTYELIVEEPGRVVVLAGNHDEALGYDGARFTADVSPSDFSEHLNDHLAHEHLVRAGKLAVRLFATAPRALFLPDGLLVAHGGIPLTDLHPELRATGDWNDPRCLSDFVWTRAHPRARRKMPNRASRGSQFAREDFADFCALAAELGRPVERMVRGHDHVEERWAVTAWPQPLLTIVSLSRRLEREAFGPFERAPCVARWVPGNLPQVHRLCVPPEIVRAAFGAPDEDTSA